MTPGNENIGCLFIYLHGQQWRYPQRHRSSRYPTECHNRKNEIEKITLHNIRKRKNSKQPKKYNRSRKFNFYFYCNRNQAIYDRFLVVNSTAELVIKKTEKNQIAFSVLAYHLSEKWTLRCQLSSKLKIFVLYLTTSNCLNAVWSQTKEQSLPR